ncbi:penicillin-binding protein 2 [Ectothiorhodospiraceae bacterium WFHF3C12]|nr:penicillin-binding protein 2 [Ectothiorhodospiraceae bacterium WFHF3C12]
MNARYREREGVALPRWRPAAVLAAFAVIAGVCAYRAVDLQVTHRPFLEGQGSARHLRVVDIPAHRGRISDRNGEPLAISAPVDSVWADPGELLTAPERIPELARMLELDQRELRRYLGERSGRSFVYIKRHVNPDLAQMVAARGFPGVALRREYRRFYPAGEVAAHVLGFTDIDDRGLEGIELAFNDWLSGEPGAKRVVKDRLGRVIEDVEQIRQPRPGRNLTLSLDRRLQYLAYRELKAAVKRHDARAGSVVMLDVRTGEVLAMVNQPAYNPNDRANLRAGRFRNRAVTDVFEPGSTIKPFTLAAAMDHGRFGPKTVIDTGPGVMRVGGNTIKDASNYGRIDMATVLRKSSNVGAAKIALQLDRGALWGQLAAVGFGSPSGTGFPGESGGSLPGKPPSRSIERATLAFGYGIAATPLQLASAYAAIANDGRRVPVTFLREDEPAAGEQVISAEAARAVRRMMEAVVSEQGTAPAARVNGYRVAGKTGTVRKAIAGGYSEDRHAALFAGMAPASDPRLVTVVVVDEPGKEAYYGGQVAAPVFGNIMDGALRLLNVPPDDVVPEDAMLAHSGGGR